MGDHCKQVGMMHPVQSHFLFYRKYAPFIWDKQADKPAPTLTHPALITTFIYNV